MKITSPAFESNTSIPTQYTCDGKGINPPLKFDEIPATAKSLALIVHDPDAPIPGGFTHWVMWNISPQTTTIAENSVPTGAMQGYNGAAKSGWYNPCPPSGTHRYEFKLYALDTKLNLPSNTDKTALEKAMSGHVLEQATLTGLYKKNVPLIGTPKLVISNQ